MIEIKEVNFSYKKGQSVLKDLNLKLEEGGVYGLLGLNGSGKTTLLNLLTGLMFPQNGSILVDGQSVGERSLETTQKIYYIPYEFDLPAMNADKYVKYYQSFYSDFNEATYYRSLKAFHIDSKHPLNKLSLGEKKKFAISFGISTKCKILVMDEPTNGLDIPSKSIFRKLLMQNTKEEQIVIISTHLLHDVEQLFSDIIVLKDAEHTYTASTTQLSRDYSFCTDTDKGGAIYAEPCTEGFQVIRENHTNEDSAINFELLFNAIMKGFIK